MPAVSDAITVILVVALAAGLPLTIRAVRRAEPAGPGPDRLAGSPGFWLTVVIAACFVNQVLFTVYMIRIHDGDASFIARYLGPGWFALADDNAAMRELASAFPAPHLLDVTLLRVQAVLELPLVLLAYLTVCRWWDRRLYRSLGGWPLVATGVVYTVTFCLIEAALRNPYTVQDIWLRVVSCPIAVILIGRLVRLGRDAPASRSAMDLALFAVSAAAMGYLVLVVYDTALLYNLAHLSSQLPGAAAAATALLAARYGARRRRPRMLPGPGIDTLTTGLGWFIALFFTPALTLRYALSFGSPALAAAAAAVVAAMAITLSATQVYRRLPAPGDRRTVARWLGQSAVAALAGILAAATAQLAPGAMEARLLLAATLFLAAATLTYVLTDPLLTRSRASR